MAVTMEKYLEIILLRVDWHFFNIWIDKKTFILVFKSGIFVLD